MEKGIKKLIGDKAFYKMVLSVAVPIIIQNAVTNFVSLLDNIMVGQVGTDPMNAVAIVNQLMFVFNLCVWGAVSGAGIFTVQYYGKNDIEGIRNTFRAKIVFTSIVLVASMLLFFLAGQSLIQAFVHQTDGIGNAEVTTQLALEYLHIMMIGLVPFIFSMSYANTLRDLGETKVPMYASLAAVFLNLLLNYVLIFGNWGAPKMGVIGAAIATSISRFVEAGVVMVYTHVKKNRFAFIQGAYRSLRIPRKLLGQILIKGLPLALNESLWALGITMMNQNYSTRSLAVVGAINITTTIVNLFSVVYFGLGESISIVVGPLLGAGKMKEAKASAQKMIAFGATVCLAIGVVLALCRNVFPGFYNTEQEVKDLAGWFILVAACMMPFSAMLHGSYFTLRTGGRTIITFLFDSVFVWVVSVTSAFFLCRYTELPIVAVYAIVTSLDLIKCVLGIVLVNKGVWVRNIVDKI